MGGGGGEEGGGGGEKKVVKDGEEVPIYTGEQAGERKRAVMGKGWGLGAPDSLHKEI